MIHYYRSQTLDLEIFLTDMSRFLNAIYNLRTERDPVSETPCYFGKLDSGQSSGTQQSQISLCAQKHLPGVTGGGPPPPGPPPPPPPPHPTHNPPGR
jgi:hypothetical protein